ncbi:MAG: hypothetical protein M3066_17225 [Actinomycetota bacterium]|nr:hypothetical protein [Actinomycetota bacterium]
MTAGASMASTIEPATEAPPRRAFVKSPVELGEDAECIVLLPVMRATPSSIPSPSAFPIGRST